MFDILTNLTKAAVSVVVTPATLVADLLCMPADAYDGKEAFPRTSGMLRNAAECAKEATKLEGGA